MIFVPILIGSTVHNFPLCFLMLISFTIQDHSEQLSALDMNKMTLSEYPVVIVGNALTGNQVKGPSIFAHIYCGIFNTKCHYRLSPYDLYHFHFFASNLYGLNGLSTEAVLIISSHLLWL